MNTAPDADTRIATIHRDSDGTPKMVELDGRSWTVVATLRYFERYPWWESASRMPRGTGRVDREILRLEVRLGSSRSQITSIELVRQGNNDWQVRAILRAA